MSEILGPSKDQAAQFALMLSSGLPSSDAIRYFLPDGDDLSPATLMAYVKRWQGSLAVQDAILAYQGKPWEGMSAEEKVRFSVEKFYVEAAYFLYSHNVAELEGAQLSKASNFRLVLEQKMAGMAGKLGGLEAFYDDILKGKVKLANPPALIN